MSQPKTSTAEILVHPVRPGVGTRDYHLFEGATFADLLRLSGTLLSNQAVFIDGIAPGEALPLYDGMVVTVMPRAKNAPGDEPWRAIVPAFRDDAVFEESSEALKACRQLIDSTQYPVRLA